MLLGGENNEGRAVTGGEEERKGSHELLKGRGAIYLKIERSRWVSPFPALLQQEDPIKADWSVGGRDAV